MPFTRLCHHFNLLEKHGFIRVVETRQQAGAFALAEGGDAPGDEA